LEWVRSGQVIEIATARLASPLQNLGRMPSLAVRLLAGLLVSLVLTGPAEAGSGAQAPARQSREAVATPRPKLLSRLFGRSAATASVPAAASTGSPGALSAEAPRRCLLDRCRAFLHSAKERFSRRKDHVWLGSSVSLGTAELGDALAASATAGQVATKTSGRLLGGLRFLGLAGAVGLAATGAHDLYRAASVSQRLDAASDLAWGVQGSINMGTAGTGLIGNMATGFGVVGAVCQTAAGCRRLYKGWKEHDRSKMKLGALDVAGGLTWLGWDVAGWSNPYFLGAYAGLMVTREVYANKDAIKAFGQRTAEKVRCAYGACKRQVASGAAWVKQGVGNTLRSLSAGLGGPRSPATASTLVH